MRLPRPLRTARRPTASERPIVPAPFIVGVPRSGTTLLRLMLDSHPELAIPPETHFVAELIRRAKAQEMDRDRVLEFLIAQPRWEHFELDPGELRERLPAGRAVKAREAVRTFFTAYADTRGKSRWGDKTPGYLQDMYRIQKVLPEARFVHIIRDARDVALSMTSMEHSLPDTASKAAGRWTKQITKALAEVPRIEHYLEVRYEALVLDTEPTLRRVCDFIELPWDPAVLDYHRDAGERLAAAAGERERPWRKDPVPAGYVHEIHALTSRPPQAARIGRWRSEMSSEDAAACHQVAGELLAQLGYEVPSGPTGDLGGRGAQSRVDG